MPPTEPDLSRRAELPAGVPVGLSGALAPPGSAARRYLDVLVADADRLLTLVAGAPGEARAQLAPGCREQAVLASLHLDGSTIAQLPDTTASWLDTLRIGEDTADADIAALETRGVQAALDATDLAAAIAVGSPAALRTLHERVTRGLVTPQRAGALREVEQAVHDASTGRIIYRATAPQHLDDALAALPARMTAASDLPAVLQAGLLELELLALHPFDAANGRTARAAARLVLHAHDRDPDQLSCPEPWLATDRLGYHDEVARTLRRRDPTIWLERWVEAVTVGLRHAARSLGVLPAAAGPPPSWLADHDDDALTLADLPEAAAGLAAAHRQAIELLDRGTLQRVPATRGLRFARGASHA